MLWIKRIQEESISWRSKMESQTKTLVNWKFINKSYENRILHRYARLAPDMYNLEWHFDNSSQDEQPRRIVYPTMLHSSKQQKKLVTTLSLMKDLQLCIYPECEIEIYRRVFSLGWWVL